MVAVDAVAVALAEEVRDEGRFPPPVRGNSVVQPLAKRSLKAVKSAPSADCQHVSDQLQRQQWRPVAASLLTPQVEHVMSDLDKVAI
jgi:hypothetical protein